MLSTPCPPWELLKPKFDINYSSLRKTDNVNILKTLVQEHIEICYADHLKIYTDGSLLSTNNAGAAFIIPSLKIEQSFYIGKNRSIFTAELTAILMALYYLLDFPKDVFNLLFCVDSKSVLHALGNSNPNVRQDLITEISHLIHCLILRGSSITFCWVPSHCGIHFNERVDKIAKRGAMNISGAKSLNVSLSLQEGYNLLQNACWKHFRKKLEDLGYTWNDNSCQTLKTYNGLKLYNQRNVTSLLYRLKLDAFKTKFSKNITCLCGERISSGHILSQCEDLKPFLPNIPKYSFQKIISDHKILWDIVVALIQSPISRYL